MNMQIEKELLARALRKGAAQERKELVSYIHFREKTGIVPRGTLIINGRVIQGYPKIARIFSLDKGLERNIPNQDAYVEEKIDGYNVRVAYIDGSVIAFSRSGMLDYFASEKLAHLEPFFKLNPNHVLCGEMVGNTPYTQPVSEYDTMFFVFDIIDDSGQYLNIDKRRAMMDSWKLTNVPLLGIVNTRNVEEFKRIAKKLNRDRKEGVVIKSLDRSITIKYVTAWSDAHDMETAAALFDLPLGFLNQRLLRSALFAREQGISKKEYAAMLGNAIATRMIREIGSGEVYEEFCIRIKDGAIWTWIQKHMSKEVRLEVVELKKERGQTIIKFRKIYKKTTKVLRDAASGKKQED